MLHRLLILLLPSILLVLTSCGTRHAAGDTAMAIAESVMDTRPDSALAILDSLSAATGAMSPASGATEASRARFALLLTQARHKNYIDETSDTLISKAVDYYSRHSSSEPRRLMLAHYYHGVIKSNARNYASAILSLMEAETLADRLNQYLWLGRARLAIGDIYNEIHSPAEEVKYAEEACETFRNANDSLNLWYAEESLITALNNAHRYNEALTLANRKYDKALIDGDTLFMSKLLNHIGYSTQHLNLHQEAIDAFRKFQALAPQKIESAHYYYLSTALWNAGRHSESKALIDSIRQIYNHKGDIHPEILYELGLINEAYQHQKRISSEANAFVREILCQNVSSAVSEYYQNEISLHEAKLRQNRLIIVATIIIVALIICLLSYRISVSHRDRKKKELEIIDLAQELNSLNLQLSSANSRLNSLSVDLSEKRKIENEKLNAISLLCEIYNSSDRDNSVKSGKISEALSFINAIASDPNLNSDLESKVNRDYSDLMRRFRQQMPNLNEGEYRLFVWSALRISAPTIQYLWGVKRNTFYSTRRRLRDKIIAAAPVEMQLFLKYLR